ncbi:hypothetical protein [Rhabdothermincola salaria]|uniref:hypothetical protein n=1 Tax=Rhabdothermincola salaria TaxID=2903142 RepID=UPI001E572362|nr:hypothetical protein [Rhabdothermincola salaria]MCD9624239.1 hypothetical protein [Rhabdothermincola salaria]
MTDSKLVKSAGEHWVCGALARLGWAGALTRDGLERTDILAVHTATGRLVEVQVKTASHSKNPKFMTGAKGCVPARSDNEWYVLVALADVAWDAPRAFVVPRDHVAAGVWIRHMEWLTNPTVPKGQRNTSITGSRSEAWIFARYEHRWDLLEMPTTEVDVMLPPRFRTWAQDDRVGLPVDHPWNADLPDWDDAEIHKDWPDWATQP